MHVINWPEAAVMITMFVCIAYAWKVYVDNE